MGAPPESGRERITGKNVGVAVACGIRLDDFVGLTVCWGVAFAVDVISDSSVAVLTEVAVGANVVGVTGSEVNRAVAVF